MSIKEAIWKTNTKEQGEYPQRTKKQRWRMTKYRPKLQEENSGPTQPRKRSRGERRARISGDAQP